MIRKKTYSIDETFKILGDSIYNPKRIKINFDGDMIKATSQRYIVFKKSCVCCKCGLKGSFFAKEKTDKDDSYHLNLYGIKEGKEILFTKDHIVPKSLGGKDKIENYQTMCSICNFEKGNKLE